MEFQRNIFVDAILPLTSEDGTVKCDLAKLTKCKHIHAILSDNNGKRVNATNVDLLYGLSYVLTALSHESFVTKLENSLRSCKLDYRVLQLLNDIYSYGIDGKKMMFDPLVWQSLLSKTNYNPAGNNSSNYVGANVSPATYENELSKLKSSLSTLQDYAIGLFTQKWLRQVDGVEQAVSILKLIYTNQ